MEEAEDALARKMLTEAAVWVAESLRSVHGLALTPSPDDYHLTEGWEAGQDRIRITIDLGRGLKIDVETIWPTSIDERREKAPIIARYIAELHQQAPEARSMMNMPARRQAKVSGSGKLWHLLSVEADTLNADWWHAPRVTVHYEALDRDLRTKVLTLCADKKTLMRERLDELDALQVNRRQIQSFLRRFAADGAIDSVLLNILRAAGVADADILQVLRSSRNLEVDVFGTNDQRFQLSWEDGCVKARPIQIGEGLVWAFGCLRFAEAPRMFSKRDVGRTVDEVFPHPLLVGTAKITRARGRKGRVASLECVRQLRLFNLEGGRFIDASANEEHFIGPRLMIRQKP